MPYVLRLDTSYIGAGARPIRAIRFAAPKPRFRVPQQRRMWCTPMGSIDAHVRRRLSAVFGSYSAELGQKCAQVPDLAPTIATKTRTHCASSSKDYERQYFSRYPMVGGAGRSVRRRAGAQGPAVENWPDGVRMLMGPRERRRCQQTSHRTGLCDVW